MGRDHEPADGVQRPRASSTRASSARCSTSRRGPLTGRGADRWHEAARDRVAVVTGAGRGLGRDVAVALGGARRTRSSGSPATADQLAETGRASSARPAAGCVALADRRQRPGRRRGAAATFVRDELGAADASSSTPPACSGRSRSIRDSDPAEWVRDRHDRRRRAVPHDPGLRRRA